VQATATRITLSAVILVAVACTLGHALLEDDRAESTALKTVPAPFRPAADIAKRSMEQINHEQARLARYPCLGHCAMAEFYNDHPSMRGRIPVLVEAVLRIKLANLLKQRLDTRSVAPRSQVRNCLAKSRSKGCPNLALVAGD
jgi:hypothetical protein